MDFRGASSNFNIVLEFQLLIPHFRNVLPVNINGRKVLFGPKAVFDMVTFKLLQLNLKPVDIIDVTMLLVSCSVLFG